MGTFYRQIISVTTLRKKDIIPDSENQAKQN